MTHALVIGVISLNVNPFAVASAGFHPRPGGGYPGQHGHGVVGPGTVPFVLDHSGRSAHRPDGPLTLPIGRARCRAGWTAMQPLCH